MGTRTGATMRLLSLSFSLFTLATSATVKTPSFSLISDRSANGTPIIAVTFPNGHSDTLVLTQFVDGDGSQKPATIPEIPEPRDGGVFFPTEDPEIPESRDCRYIGHLRSEPEACLAMTGCVGSGMLNSPSFQNMPLNQASINGTSMD